jgi:TonB family protein
MTGANECDPADAEAGGDNDPPPEEALAPEELVAAQVSAVRAPRARRSSRKSGAIALGLSIAIHALVLVLLVRAGILFVPASVAVRGGAASGEAANEVAGDGGAMRASGAVAVPAAAEAWAPPPVDLLSEVPAESLPVPQGAPDLAGRLTERDARPLAIGFAGTDLAPADATFPHHYPAQWQHGRAGDSRGAGQEAGGSGRVSTGPAATDSAAHGGGGQGADGFSPSGGAQNKPPAYPAEARRLKYEGTVWLLVDVLEDGSVGDISIDQTSGHEILDRAAVNAVRCWVFSPARKGGHPVRSQGRVPIRFVLHG